jgi:Zn-dependent metalloprotease
MRTTNAPWILAVLALGACSDGRSGGDVFARGAEPTLEEFAQGVPNDQTPPPGIELPETAPRDKLPVEPLSATDRAKAEADGTALARGHLAARRFGADADVLCEEVHPDEYGRVHVKMTQTHQGVPVLGAGIAAHLGAGVPDEITETLVDGLTLSTVPSVTSSAAVATARALYPTRSAPPVESARLVVVPTLDLSPLAFPQGPTPNTDDFSWELVDAKLAWEVTLGPAALDRAAVAAAARGASAHNTEVDDPATIAAKEAAVVLGGNPPNEPDFQDFGATIDDPPMRYLIDADSGDVLAEELDVDYGDSPAEGTGYGWFSGRVTLDTTFDDGLGRYLLIDNERPTDGIGNITWDARNDETHDADEMFQLGDSNNSWGDGSIQGTEDSAFASTRRQTPAVDVAYGVQVTWDLFDHVLGRVGLDAQGTSLWTAVHWGDGYVDAHYNRSSRFCVFGDDDAPDEPGNYDIDTVAHELGHWFWHASGVKSEKGESAAMNEGHGDVQGSLARFYKDSSDAKSGVIRHFPALGGWKRRLAKPHTYSEAGPGGFPQQGQRYWHPDLKDFEEHVAGIPFGRAFMHLAQGASPDPDSDLYTTEFPDGMAGIGLTKAAHIWNLAVSSYLVGTPTYHHARSAFLSAAAFLYGAGSMEHNAVKRAFHAIRVGAKVTDVEAPEFLWAGIWAVNLTDMTALALPIVRDDCGVAVIRAEGVNMELRNRGYHEPGYPLGYVNISRAPLGQNTIEFVAQDGRGRMATKKRTFVKSADRNLIVNGDFEGGLTGWDAVTDGPHVPEDERRAFIGTGYLAFEGADDVEQEVTIPAGADAATLVFRIQPRNGVTANDFLWVDVRSAGGAHLETLATYDRFTPGKASRTPLNRGYARQELDLSDYAGQTIRIGFRDQSADGAFRFVIDQVVLTYEEDVFVDVPKVHLFEWENTVAFQLPTIEGILDSEISRVEYWTDQGLATFSTNHLFDWYASAHLDDLGPGAHWVGARVRGLDNQVLAHSGGVWWVPYQVNELLENGGFEDGAWDLTYSDLPPRVEVEENDVHGTVSYDGQRVMRMGGQGSAHTSRIGQLVHVPKSLKTLTFSARIEARATDLPDNDNLDVELWDASKFELIETYPLSEAEFVHTTPGELHSFKDFWRREIALPPGKYAGKSVIVLILVNELEDGDPTNFWIDNVSLRYTNFGIVLPPEPPPPPDGDEL